MKEVIGQIKELGGEPFIISAMGSHGGGTPEGQREVLASYGITEENIGVGIVTSVDVVRLGRTSGGIDVYFDSAALGADLIVPINRVKPVSYTHLDVYKRQYPRSPGRTV